MALIIPKDADIFRYGGEGQPFWVIYSVGQTQFAYKVPADQAGSFDMSNMPLYERPAGQSPDDQTPEWPDAIKAGDATELADVAAGFGTFSQFYSYTRNGIIEISIRDAEHEDATFSMEMTGITGEQLSFISTLTAAAFSLFGFHEWAARLWTALTGFLGVLMVAWLAGRLRGDLHGEPAPPASDAPGAGLLGAVVLGSTAIYVFSGHFLTLDMGVAFFMSAAVFSVAMAQRDEADAPEHRNWMLAGWACMALAVLSKEIGRAHV